MVNHTSGTERRARNRLGLVRVGRAWTTALCIGVLASIATAQSDSTTLWQTPASTVEQRKAKEPANSKAVVARRVDMISATKAVVVSSDRAAEDPSQLQEMPAMERAVRGLGALLNRDQIATLKRAVRQPVSASAIDDRARQRWWITLGDRVLEQSPQGVERDIRTRLSVLAAPNGELFVRREPSSAAAKAGPAFRLDAELALSVLDPAGVSAFRSPLDQPLGTSPAPGELGDLEGTLAASDLLLDSKQLALRVLFNGSTLHSTSRKLDEETLWVRVPKTVSVRKPLGVLLWISPSPDANGAPLFHPEWSKVLDEFNIIVVGARNAGNARNYPDRLQLALDGLATVRSRFQIDPTRVYVSGFSGGGRLSSMIGCALTDRLRGAIPMGGLNSHIAVTPKDGKSVRASFSTPGGATGKKWPGVRGVRIAAITGSEDFNQSEVQLRLPHFAALGFETRLFDVPGLSHALPDATTFREALAWVDAPAQAAKARQDEAAAEAWRAVKLEIDQTPPPPVADRTRRLREIIERHPWTSSAWEAMDRVYPPSTAAPATK